MEQRHAQISNDIHKTVLRFLKAFDAYDLYMQLNKFSENLRRILDLEEKVIQDKA